MNKPTNKELGQQLVRNNKLAVSFRRSRKPSGKTIELKIPLTGEDISKILKTEQKVDCANLKINLINSKIRSY